MPFSDKRNLSIKNLQKFKGYWRNFGEKRKERSGRLGEKDGKQEAAIRDTKSANRRTRLLKRTAWPAVDELVGLPSQEDQPQRHRSTRQMSIKTSLTESSIIRIIHCDARLKSLFRLPKHLCPIIVCCCYIHISQSSVGTQLSCGVIFNNVVSASVSRMRQWKNKIG